MFDSPTRITRRRSSAGPVPPQRPQQPRPRPRDPALRESSSPAGTALTLTSQGGGPQGSGPLGGGSRPTFLTLRDHGKVYVADLPRLSDGQLAHIAREASMVLESINRRLEEIDRQAFPGQAEQDTRIRAGTKRDVTQRFLTAIAQEQELRRSNPALRAAAGESLARAFLELARHRLPGSTFDSLLQEALTACGPNAAGDAAGDDPQVLRLLQKPEPPEPRAAALPVVLTPDPQRDAPARAS